MAPFSTASPLAGGTRARTNYRFLAQKTTFLTDCRTGVILDVHCTTSRPHDTQIGWQVLIKNVDRLDVLTTNKGYDWKEFRWMLREHDGCQLIKHREFDSLNKAHNAGLDDPQLHHRSVAKCSFRVLEQRYGDRLRAHTWYGQFRKFVLKAAVKNVDTGNWCLTLLTPDRSTRPIMSYS